MESVRALRDRLALARQAAGLSLKRAFERIPADKAALIPWLESIFPIRPPKWDDMTIDLILLPEAAGKTFSQIIEGVFSDLRHGIAHALFEGGELTVSIDDQVKLEVIHRWLPLARCMARRMLKNEFPGVVLQGLPEPPADGT